jgi:hypothetical protein
MSQDITTKNDINPIDFFKGFGHETSSKMWVGQLLKFQKGDFVTGEEDTKVELGTRFIAMMPTTLDGWIKWEGGRPVAHEMGLVIEGFKSPKREALGDDDESEWEDDGNGKPRDPWARGNYVVFIDAETKDVYTFASGSKGGRSALGELALKYHQHAKMYPTQVPMVELGASSYKHPSFGKVHTPTFKIVEWVEQKEYLSLLTAAGDEDETEATKVTVKKAAPKKITVKPAVAAKAKGKANNGKRPVRFA